MDAGMTSMMIVMVLGWLAVLAALVGAVWWLVSRFNQPRTDAALAGLRERYARGEITREEFEAKRKDLAA